MKFGRILQRVVPQNSGQFDNLEIQDNPAKEILVSRDIIQPI